MNDSSLLWNTKPQMPANTTLLLALSGWMDGGSVSTGTVKQFMVDRPVVGVARIDPAGFYIESFPGTMEINALFRPHVKHDDGLLESIQLPTNEFHADIAHGLVFMVGKEPNLRWEQFGECVFEVCREMNVGKIVAVGSFGGAVPHTRAPRLYGTVSERSLLGVLKEHQLRPSDYEGPGSFSSYLMSQAPSRGIQMLSVAAEIPGYLDGENPVSIETVARRVSALIETPINLASLREAGTTWELQVSEAVDKDEKLANTVKKLEERYDTELIEESE